jgi:hypothetical protein
VSELVPEIRQILTAGRRYAGANGRGVLGSLALHALLAFLVVVVVARHTAEIASRPPHLPPFVPVELIRLADETRSPPAERFSPVPQQKAGRPQDAASPTPHGVSPTGTKPVDALDAKLKALARLKQPDNKLTLADGTGVSNVDASNGASGNAATYAIRDYVLAQVLRRWTLNLSRVGTRTMTVKIAVVMKRDGSIVTADIVEQARAKTDAVFRDIAIGARNAVLLSSPVPLPAGDYPKEMHFTLLMDTRAVLR